MATISKPLAPKNDQSEDLNSVDIKQRQHLIDSLLIELDRKSEAVQKIGSDCVSLRVENKKLRKEIARLSEQLKESDLQTSRLINAFDIDLLPLKELQRRYAQLSGKLETTIRKSKEYESKLEELQGIKHERDKYKEEAKQLREAHHAQQQLVLDLQENVQKSQKCKSVILKQETVISELEKRIAELELSKRQWTDQPIYMGKEQENKTFQVDNFNLDNSNVSDLEKRALAAEMRCQALEAQLVQTAKEFGRQLFQLRNK